MIYFEVFSIGFALGVMPRMIQGLETDRDSVTSGDMFWSLVGIFSQLIAFISVLELVFNHIIIK